MPLLGAQSAKAYIQSLFVWVSYEKPSSSCRAMQCYRLGCMRNLNLITLGSERVNQRGRAGWKKWVEWPKQASMERLFDYSFFCQGDYTFVPMNCLIINCLNKGMGGTKCQTTTKRPTATTTVCDTPPLPTHAHTTPPLSFSTHPHPTPHNPSTLPHTHTTQADTHIKNPLCPAPCQQMQLPSGDSTCCGRTDGPGRVVVRRYLPPWRQLLEGSTRPWRFGMPSGLASPRRVGRGPWPLWHQ